MKKLPISLLAVLPLLLLPLDSFADKDMGPGDRAYERANDNASFKRDDDNKDDKDHKDKKKDKQHRDDNDKKGNNDSNNEKKGRFD